VTKGMKMEARILVDMVVYVSRLVFENKTYFDGSCVFPYQGFKLMLISMRLAMI
jgi:hypothetical protein